MAVPNGMWECRNCGDYVDNDMAFCPHCGTGKPGMHRSVATLKASTEKKASSIYQPMSRKERIGETVQYFAIAIFVIDIITTIITAFTNSKDRYGDIQFGSFLLILLAGIAVSVIVSMLIYAFGCLVGNSTVMRQNSEMSLKYLERIMSNREAASTAQKNSADVWAQIDQLGQLHRQGALSDEEFQRLKDELLRKL